MKGKREPLARLARHTRGEVRELLRAVAHPERWCGRYDGRHLVLYHDNGGVLIGSATPGDRRTVLNMRAQMRRIERKES